MRSRFPLVGLLALALASLPAAAQGVLVAPPGVFLDHRTRTAAIELYNPGTESVEVRISTLFGYPVSDSTGHVSLFTSETPPADAPSASAWIEAFPRRLTLAPLARQTVRLLARPPADLPDGEYWTRLVVESKAAAAPQLAATDAPGIQIGLSLTVRTLIAALYRKGPVQTGVTLSGLRATPDGDSLVVRLRLERTGNAAFLGTVHLALVDDAGREVAARAVPTAVYHELEPRLALPLAGARDGAHVLRVRVDTERTDVRRESLLPVAPLSDSVRVVLQPR